MEAGLELLLALLRHAKDYSEGIHKLFPRIPDMLEGDFDNLKQVGRSCTTFSGTLCNRTDGGVIGLQSG